MIINTVARQSKQTCSCPVGETHQLQPNQNCQSIRCGAVYYLHPLRFFFFFLLCFAECGHRVQVINSRLILHSTPVTPQFCCTPQPSLSRTCPNLICTKSQINARRDPSISRKGTAWDVTYSPRRPVPKTHVTLTRQTTQTAAPKPNRPALDVPKQKARRVKRYHHGPRFVTDFAQPN